MYNSGFVWAPEPTFDVTIIGGTHGNEPAGCYAAEYLLDSDYFDRIGIYGCIIPRANPIGVFLGRRLCGFTDINRNYTIPEPTGRPNMDIARLCRRSKLVIDLHEGWGYYRDKKNSIGSTISLNSNMFVASGRQPDMFVASKSDNLLRSCVAAAKYVNSKIRDPRKLFTVIDSKPDIPGTLSLYCKYYGIPYVLIETSGQNNIQPLHLRTQQMIDIIDIILR